ncbi:MAG: FAD-dependent oxidoreductase [Mariprofundaceae bacterium]|nr:FAD-dependent oxidoreductase [Mariprofundaceae bacterium]
MNKNIKKGLIISFAALIFICFFAFNLDSYFHLHVLKEQLHSLQQAYQENPVQTIALFFILYVLFAAFSLPGAVILTLAAGAVFGVIGGTIIASFASSLGALCAFFISRYLFHDWVQTRFQQQLQAINAGIQKDGAFYLFGLRLIPLFPFFIVNVLMGLTTIRPWTYYWVSQVGMLAATLVYVNAGTQLAQLNTLSDILSPSLLFSFILLGLFPLIASKGLHMFSKRRLYSKWKKPKTFDRNLIVIGAGAAGLVSSYIAATVKAKVTLVEAHKMGGDCLNYGCVPSKSLIKSARLARQIRHADHYGLEASQPRLSFKKVMARVHAIIAAIAPHDSVERYSELGVDVQQGYARIIDPWTVEISHKEGHKTKLSTQNIIVAAGASPIIPNIEGLDDVGYVTSDTLWDTFAKLDDVPQHLVVLGGGPIGCELAQSLACLGSQVVQIVRGNRIMAREDSDVSELAMTAMQKDGIEVLLQHDVIRCERDGDQKFIIIQDQEKNERRIQFDQLLCAIGRAPRLSGYGLEDLGIETNRTVVTNDYLQTIYPNILAAGDVSGPYQFTHVAAHQAWYATVNALFGHLKKFKVDYSVVPWTTFIDPEVARVGLNEQEAKEKGIAYELTTYPMDDLDRAIADGTTQGFVKILTVPNKDKILGVCIVGEHAGDLIAEFVLAMQHGLGLNKIMATIHTYPTLAEANKYVAGAWKKNHAPKKLISWVEKYLAWKRG